MLHICIVLLCICIEMSWQLLFFLYVATIVIVKIFGIFMLNCQNIRHFMPNYSKYCIINMIFNDWVLHGGVEGKRKLCPVVYYNMCLGI